MSNSFDNRPWTFGILAFMATVYFATASCHRASEGATVDIRRFGARCDGKTDDTRAVQAAIDSGAGEVLISGVALVHGLSLNQRHGLVIKGAGPGSWRGERVMTGLIFNGTPGGSVVSSTESCNVRLQDINIDGNNVATGFWFRNKTTGTAETNLTTFVNVTFTKCSNGIRVGGNPTTYSNNYDQIVAEACSFYNCSVAVNSQSNATEFMRFRNAFFIGGGKYYFLTNTISFCQLEDVYFGAMRPGAEGAVRGAFVLDWSDVWVELQREGTYTAMINDSGYQVASHLRRCYFTDRGDSKYVNVYWGSGTNLIIESSVITGKITYAKAKRGAAVTVLASAFEPAGSACTTLAGKNPPPIASGNFAVATPRMCEIEIVRGGRVNEASFRWRYTDGDFSRPAVARNLVHLDSGLLLEFAGGYIYAAGDKWLYHCSPTGLVEQDGERPDNVDIVQLQYRQAQVITPRAETTLVWDWPESDAYHQYRSGTGAVEILKPGYYDCRCRITLRHGTPGSQVALRLRRNDLELETSWTEATSARLRTVNLEGFEYLQAGDLITTTLYHDGNSSIDIAPDAGTALSLRRVPFASSP